jgi:aspartokinase/homoserine dehydrogenase 1
MKAFLRKEEGFFLFYRLLKMKVLKFGGTSVGSVNSIQTLLNILKDEDKPGNRPVVVLSAMGGVTNLLVSMAEERGRRQRVYRPTGRVGKTPL